MHFPKIDVGPQVLKDIYQAMSIDPEWSVWSNRQFTWWGWKCAQTIRASQPYESVNHTVTNIVAVTDFLRDVPDTPKTHVAINALNGLASMSAVLWHPPQRKVRLGYSAVFHAGNAPWLTKVFYTAATIQAAEANIRAEAFAEVLECTPDWSAHPVNGFRQKPDDLMCIHGFFLAEHSDRSLYTERDMQEAVRELRAHGTTSFATGTMLTAEFPFFGKRTAAELILETAQFVSDHNRGYSLPNDMPNGNETALLCADCDVEHPLAGKGALFLLRLPVSNAMNDAVTHSLAYELNRRSIYAPDFLPHLLGGWAVDPFSGCVTCVSFLPSNIAYPGIIKVICLNEGVKTFWALECYRRMREVQ